MKENNNFMTKHLVINKILELGMSIMIYTKTETIGKMKISSIVT